MTNYPDALNLNSIFSRSLQKYADRIAIRFGDDELTYADLDSRANSVANGLVDRGIEVNDRVALMTSNRLEYVIADLGIIKAGATKLPLNDMLTDAEFEYMLSDSGASTVICGPNFVETVDNISSSLPHLEHQIGIAPDESLPDGFESFALLDGDSSTAPERMPDPTDIAGHFYTGGTTGRPKGVIHSHEGMTMALYAHVMELSITEDETMYLMTPLPHSAGMFLWGGLLRGATIVIDDGFEPESALEEIATNAVSWVFMVPTMIYRLLDHPELSEYDTESLESIIYGAAPMTPTRLKEGIDAFGPIFLQFYGQTELPNVITTLGKKEHHHALKSGHRQRLSSAGQPCAMADVKIVDPESGEPVPTDEEGEILATAPYTMEEYFKRPDATDETVADGWIHTGDIGRIDDDGFVYLLDRVSDMIITGGLNVYSTEVEEALDEIEMVQEVAVIGVPDDDWGEAVKAVVVPHEADTASADAIHSYADAELASYKKPKSVDFVSEIPKTPYGKMDKKALRERYWEEENRSIN
jgi:fatty-acyl-CoA synthase